MTEEEINIIIANDERVRLEFKKAENEVPKSLYETICAFLNKEGGTILLGVDDDGTVSGIDCSRVEAMISNIAITVNNADSFYPATTIDPFRVKYQNKCIIYFTDLFNLGLPVYEHR